jgi:hypothetical protein
MDSFRKSLIEELMLTLKIPQGNFNYSTIEDELEHIPNEQLRGYYKEVMNSESFGNGMKAIIKTAEKYKAEKTDNLLAGTREQAKAMYDKFYSECCSMLEYTCKNREKHPNDTEFFLNMPYEALKRKDGTQTYTKQELYVLNALGGGEFLLGIRLALSSKDIIDKIERVIKEAVMTKYSNQPAISYEVKKMLTK